MPEEQKDKETQENKENQPQTAPEKAEETTPTPAVEEQRKETNKKIKTTTEKTPANNKETQESSSAKKEVKQEDTKKEVKQEDTKKEVKQEETKKEVKQEETKKDGENKASDTITDKSQEKDTKNSKEKKKKKESAPVKKSNDKGNSEAEKPILELLAPSTPELTDLGKAFVFGAKESAKGLGRVGYGIIEPTMGILNSSLKIVTDFINPKRVFKKPATWFSNFGRIGSSSLKGLFNIVTSPATIAGGFYRGFYETAKVFDKKILQNTPFICYASQYLLMPLLSFGNSIISGVDEMAYKGYIGLDKLDKKFKAKQFEK